MHLIHKIDSVQVSLLSPCVQLISDQLHVDSGLRLVLVFKRCDLSSCNTPTSLSSFLSISRHPHNNADLLPAAQCSVQKESVTQLVQTDVCWSSSFELTFYDGFHLHCCREAAFFHPSVLSPAVCSHTDWSPYPAGTEFSC